MKTENYNPRFFKLMLFFALLVSTNSGSKKDLTTSQSQVQIESIPGELDVTWESTPLVSEFINYKN